MRRRRHVVEIELGDLADGLENRVELRAEALDLLLGQREARELRNVEHLVSRDRHRGVILPKKRAPFGARDNSVPKGKLFGLHVRVLGAFRPLDHLERHALAFGQRLVALHRDRGKVDEYVVATLTLDEAVALLVRKPLHGALRQNSSLQQATARAPSRRPMITTRRSVAQAAGNASTPRRKRAARTA